MAVIGKNVSKRSLVCSQHFTESQIKYQVLKNGSIRRIILPNSVPSKDKVKRSPVYDSEKIKEESYDNSSTNEEIEVECEMEFHEAVKVEHGDQFLTNDEHTQEKIAPFNDGINNSNISFEMNECGPEVDNDR